MSRLTYDGSSFQLSDDYLEHYGVKGMKWGVRRAKSKVKGAGKTVWKKYKNYLDEHDIYGVDARGRRNIKNNLYYDERQRLGKRHLTLKEKGNVLIKNRDKFIAFNTRNQVPRLTDEQVRDKAYHEYRMTGKENLGQAWLYKERGQFHKSGPIYDSYHKNASALADKRIKENRELIAKQDEARKAIEYLASRDYRRDKKRKAKQ